MGYESNTWRKQNMLVGLCDDLQRHEGDYYRKRLGGLAVPWWADETYKGAYPGFIPLEAVEKLLGYEIDDDVIEYRVPCDMDDPRMDGIYPEGHKRAGMPFRRVVSPYIMVFGNKDYDQPFGVFTRDGFKINQMRDTLIDLPAAILDQGKGELGIASALLMRGGGIGMVTIELPECMEVRGVDFKYRPSLGVVDAYTGELKIGAYMMCRVPCCENGAAQFTSGAVTRYALKHTGRHQERLGEMRDALGLMWKVVGNYEKQIRALGDWRVGKQDWEKLLDAMVPMPDADVQDGKVANQRSINNAERKRDALTNLYKADERAASWKGSALGVFQAFNTYAQHERVFRVSGRGINREDTVGSAAQVETDEGGRASEGTVTLTMSADGKTTDRLERMYLNVAKGMQAKGDRMVLETLAAVQGKRMEELVPG